MLTLEKATKSSTSGEVLVSKKVNVTAIIERMSCE